MKKRPHHPPGAGSLLACVILLMAAACHSAPGSAPDADGAVDGGDAGPPPTTHLVILHTADEVGYLDPCG